jgi:hypothetical protein
VFFLGWSFWAWVEERRERRRLARGDPAPTSDPTGWRQQLGLPIAQAPEESARLKRLEEQAFESIHKRVQSHDEVEPPRS